MRVVQIGLGPVGQMLTPYLFEREGLRIVGAVDIDPGKTGKTLGELTGIEGLDITVHANLQEEVAQGADVAVITTVSCLERLMPLLEAVLREGIHVVSTCEELSFPWQTKPDLAARIDRIAKENGVSVLGTGINPGFLMDCLVAVSTALCRTVESIRIERIQDASYRRLPFRQKIGAGLSIEEFEKKASAGEIRHVGLTESMHMVAEAMGWRLDRTEDLVEPILAEEDVTGEGWVVPKGRATGVSQTGRGTCGGEEVLTLVFRASVGERCPRDRVFVKGIPEIDMTIAGGVNGDVGTCAIVTNALPRVLAADPGLKTMLDLPPITCRRANAP